MARALTVKSVESVAASSDRREIPDGYLRGLYLVVQPSGAKSWAVRYRHGGRPRKFTIGSYPVFDLKAARDAGSKALRAAAEGRRPRPCEKTGGGQCRVRCGPIPRAARQAQLPPEAAKGSRAPITPARPRQLARPQDQRDQACRCSQCAGADSRGRCAYRGQPCARRCAQTLQLVLGAGNHRGIALRRAEAAGREGRFPRPGTERRRAAPSMAGGRKSSGRPTALWCGCLF